MHNVNLYLEKHISCWTIQKKYGIPSSKFQSWAQSYLLDGRKGSKPNKKGEPYMALHTSKHPTERHQLQ